MLDPNQRNTYTKRNYLLCAKTLGFSPARPKVLSFEGA
jgi:hypothetical protein